MQHGHKKLKVGNYIPEAINTKREEKMHDLIDIILESSIDSSLEREIKDMEDDYY